MIKTEKELSANISLGTSEERLMMMSSWSRFDLIVSHAYKCFLAQDSIHADKLSTTFENTSNEDEQCFTRCSPYVAKKQNKDDVKSRAGSHRGNNALQLLSLLIGKYWCPTMIDDISMIDGRSATLGITDHHLLSIRSHAPSSPCNRHALKKLCIRRPFKHRKARPHVHSTRHLSFPSFFNVDGIRHSAPGLSLIDIIPHVIGRTYRILPQLSAYSVSNALSFRLCSPLVFCYASSF
jgi:hypothetical protein